MKNILLETNALNDYKTSEFAGILFRTKISREFIFQFSEMTQKRVQKNI